MQSVSALGDPFVESGPSDQIGKPFGTIPRLVQALDAIGYQAAITTRPGPSEPASSWWRRYFPTSGSATSS